MITDSFEFLAEQVSHHPPVTAWYCHGTEPGAEYKLIGNFVTKTTFSGSYFVFRQAVPHILEIPGPEGKEYYRISCPSLSAHNLIMGKPYLDMGDSATITRIDPNKEVQDHCTVNFYRRGWTSNGNNYKVDGDVVIDGVPSGVSLHGLHRCVVDHAVIILEGSGFAASITTARNALNIILCI